MRAWRRTRLGQRRRYGSWGRGESPVRESHNGTVIGMSTYQPPIAVLQVDGLDAEVTDLQRVPLTALEPSAPSSLPPYPQIDRTTAKAHGLWLCNDARPGAAGTTQGAHLVTGAQLRAHAPHHPTPWNPPTHYEVGSRG